MTEITYEVREQDLIAFNEHQLREAEHIQKILSRHQATIPGILGAIALGIWLVYQDTLSAIFVGVIAVAWGLLSPLYVAWNSRRQIRKMYSDQERASAIGQYSLRIEPKALVEISREGESRLPWEEVLRVETNKKYAFVFVTLDSALIIPQATVSKGNLIEFVKEAEALIEQAS